MNLIVGLKAAFSFLSSVFIVISVCFLGRFQQKPIFFSQYFIFVCFLFPFFLQAGSWCTSFSCSASKLCVNCWVSETKQLRTATSRSQSLRKFVAIKIFPPSHNQKSPDHHHERQMRKTRGLDEHAALQFALPARELSNEILLLSRINLVSLQSSLIAS